MKALVHIENGQLIQLVADSETLFETHSDYAWKDFDETGLAYNPDEDNPPEVIYDKGTDTISRRPAENTTYVDARHHAYNPVPEQLDQLWHDIDEGKLGETAKTGTWYLGVKSTKAAYPKT